MESNNIWSLHLTSLTDQDVFKVSLAHLQIFWYLLNLQAPTLSLSFLASYFIEEAGAFDGSFPKSGSCDCTVMLQSKGVFCISAAWQVDTEAWSDSGSVPSAWLSRGPHSLIRWCVASVSRVLWCQRLLMLDARIHWFSGVSKCPYS